MATTDVPTLELQSKTRWLSNMCSLTIEGDLVVAAIAGAPLLRFASDDRQGRLSAAAVLSEAAVAPVGVVAEALTVDLATLWRARQRLRNGGLAELAPRKRGAKGPSKLKRAVRQRIIELRAKKLSIGRISERVGVSPSSVKRVLGDEGPPQGDSTGIFPWSADPEKMGVMESTTASTPPAQETTDGIDGSAVDRVDTGTLDAVDASAVGTDASAVDAVDASAVGTADASAVNSVDASAVDTADASAVDTADASAVGTADASAVNSVDASAVDTADASAVIPEVARLAPTQEAARLYATLGLSRDGESEVVFESASNVQFAGLLLVIPVLTATGLLSVARESYSRLRRGIYGLRATILTLLFLAFLRRPQAESLKGTDPGALGDVLGLLRAPEVKTVRRKLREIGEAGKAHALLRGLGSRWLKEADDALGLLYIDGHVRVYDGKHKLPKAHVTQKSLCLRATTDYWVNAVDGQPLFVVTAQANAHMTKVLPNLLSEVAELRGERRGTVVFDRGGWSLDLFKALCVNGWDILTYRKGKRDPHSADGFSRHTLDIDGRQVAYTLSERAVTFKNGLELREIAELRDDGGQTILVTSRRCDPAVLLAHRMFQRWRQENYFKYMSENFALDALVNYGVEADDPTRDVPNPARKAHDREIAAARADLAKLEQEYGAAAVDNQESEHPTMRGFKIANGETGKRLRAARRKIEELRAQRRSLPKRVPVGEVLGADAVVRLEPERKLFTDLIKSTAYRAETTLHNMLRSHLKTADKEGRAFLRAVVRQTGELLVDGDNVTVRLAAMSAPRYTAALRGLCDELNALAPVFPETRYRLRYDVAPHPELSAS